MLLFIYPLHELDFAITYIFKQIEVSSGGDIFHASELFFTNF